MNHLLPWLHQGQLIALLAWLGHPCNKRYQHGPGSGSGLLWSIQRRPCAVQGYCVPLSHVRGGSEAVLSSQHTVSSSPTVSFGFRSAVLSHQGHLSSKVNVLCAVQGYCVPLDMALEGPRCRAERPTASATAACGGSSLCWVPSEDTGASMLRQSEASSMSTAAGGSVSSSSGSSWQQLSGKVSSREAIARSLEGLKSSARDQVKGHVVC